jgi:hypothetical protein
MSVPFKVETTNFTNLSYALAVTYSWGTAGYWRLTEIACRS